MLYVTIFTDGINPTFVVCTTLCKTNPHSHKTKTASQQKQNPHGKNKIRTAKKSARQNKNCTAIKIKSARQQKQSPHGKNKIRTANQKLHANKNKIRTATKTARQKNPARQK
jgi:hypothetical protein